jgi:hypothetical protein
MPAATAATIRDHIPARPAVAYDRRAPSCRGYPRSPRVAVQFQPALLPAGAPCGGAEDHLDPGLRESS